MLPLRGTLAPLGRAAGVVDPRVFYDEFTDTENLDLTLHTPNLAPAGGWFSINSGPSRIVGNRCRPGTSSIVTGVDLGLSDYTARMTLLHNPGSVRFVLRATDYANLWYVQMTATTFRIYERTAGVDTQRASTAITATAGVMYPVQVVALGQSIVATWNNTASISYNLAAQGETETVIGVNATSTGCLLDTLEVLR